MESLIGWIGSPNNGFLSLNGINGVEKGRIGEGVMVRKEELARV